MYYKLDIYYECTLQVTMIQMDNAVDQINRYPVDKR